MTRRVALSLTLLSWGCADLSLGVPGCVGQPGRPFVSTPQNTVRGAANTVLTAAGVDLLIAEREALVGLLLAVDDQGWVHLSVPPFDFGRGGGGLGVGLREVEVGFDLRGVDLGLDVLPDPARLRLTVRGARLRLFDGIAWVSMGGDAACRLGNGLDVGTPSEALVVADVALDITPRVDAEGRLVAAVEVLPFTLHDLDFRLIYDAALPECADGVTAAECRVACSAGDLFARLSEALYAALRDRLNELLRPAIQALTDALIGRLLDAPLTVEGWLHPRALADLLPTATDGHPVAFRLAPSPEGFSLRSGGGRGDGVGLTADLGMEVEDHPCVPYVEGAPPVFAPGPPPTLTGYDQAGVPYHLGLSLSQAVANRALWVAYRGGTLCLALDSDELEALLGQRVDTDALALVLPGLRELTLGPRPLLIALDPAFVASDFPLVTFFEVADDGGIPQAGISARLPRLGLSVYALVEGRWSRLFQVRATVEVGLRVQAVGGDRLLVAVDTPRVSELSEGYGELLEGANVPELLRLVVDLASTSLLREGLSLDVGLDGLLGRVSALRGLPLQPRIVALRTEGERADFLSVLTALIPRGPGAGLAAVAETTASVVRVEAGAVVLRVGSPGAVQARYQWRLGRGPWRPLRAAPGGLLRVEEPRLRLGGVAEVWVRAVAVGAPASVDPTPAVVHFGARPRPSGVAPRVAPASNGCAQGPASSAPWGALWWALLALLALGRARLSLVALVLLVGCEDRRSAATVRCTDAAECPGGLECLEGRCLPPVLCAESADCCPGAECRVGHCAAVRVGCDEAHPCLEVDHLCVEGRCLRRPCGAQADCEVGALCLAGHCERGPPCAGRCAADEACFAHLDACRRVPCPLGCGPGQVRLAVEPEAYLGPLCDLPSAECVCADAPALRPADFGRHAAMAVLANRSLFAAYDADFGDLVLVEGVETGRPTVRYLDGVPAVSPQAAPSGPRAGITAPGPDRGGYVDLRFDRKGRPQIAYYDADAGDLRYLRADDAGTWLPPIVVDAEGDVGRWPKLRVDSAGGVHILYHVARTLDGQTGLRYAYSARPEPRGPGDFVHLDVSLRPAPADEPQAPPPGAPSHAHGQRPCVDLGLDGRLYGAFYDGAEGWPYLLRGGGTEGLSFQVSRLTAQRAEGWPSDPGGRYEHLERHDLGRFCALVADFGVGLRVVLTDGDTGALLSYSGPAAGGGTLEVVDPGGRGVRRFLGADPALALDSQGRPVVIYQDATENDLLLSVRGESGWSATPFTVASDGALGFYNSLSFVGDEAVIGTLEMKTTATGRGAHRLHVFRLAVPRF